MNLLLYLTFLASLSHAACVWIRTTSDNTSTAYCVDDANPISEGYFHFPLGPEQRSNMSSLKLHKTLNTLYRQHQRRLILSHMRKAPYNWTVFAAELFNTGMDLYDNLINAFDDRLRSLRGVEKYPTIPFSTCMNSHNEDCLLRVDDNVLRMSDGQLAALEKDITTACERYEMHVKTDTRVEEIIQRGCCRCGVGEDHVAEGRPGHVVFRKEELVDWLLDGESIAEGGVVNRVVDREGHDEL